MSKEHDSMLHNSEFRRRNSDSEEYIKKAMIHILQKISH